MRQCLILMIGSLMMAGASLQAKDWVVYEGKEGPGKGKHIVFVTGDEEYRSEEGMPMLAKILAVRHGFRCTVLFSLNPTDGTIDPNNQTNIVGLQNLRGADMMVLFTRFREPSDEQMKGIADFLQAGKPLLGIRTATHAFSFDRNKNGAYANMIGAVKSGQAVSVSKFWARPGSVIMAFTARRAREELLARL